MPKEIDRTTLVRLVDSGAQLVEVLSAQEYDEDHLPGAVSIPLKHIDVEATLQKRSCLVTGQSETSRR